MTTFTSKSAARKDAQTKGLTLGEIEITFNEKAKTYSWKPMEPVPVVVAAEPEKKPAPKKGAKKKAKKNTNSAMSSKRKGRFGNDQKIKLLVIDNPCRKGSKGHEVFATYKDGQTVAENLAAGGVRREQNWAVSKNWISID